MVRIVWPPQSTVIDQRRFPDAAATVAQLFAERTLCLPRSRRTAYERPQTRPRLPRLHNRAGITRLGRFWSRCLGLFETERSAQVLSCFGVQKRAIQLLIDVRASEPDIRVSRRVDDGPHDAAHDVTQFGVVGHKCSFSDLQTASMNDLASEVVVALHRFKQREALIVV